MSYCSSLLFIHYSYEFNQLVCLDGNSSVATIHHVLRICSDAGVPSECGLLCASLIDSVSQYGMNQLACQRQQDHSSNCFPTYLSPNLSELRAIYHQVTGEAVSTTHIAGKCVFLLIILGIVQYGIFLWQI